MSTIYRNRTRRFPSTSFRPQGEGDSFQRRVYGYYTSWGMSWMNTHRPDLAEAHALLSAAIESDLVENHPEAIIPTLAPGDVRDARRVGIEAEKVDTLCSSASTWILSEWRPDETARRAAAGAKGGSISKRRRVFTADMLDGLLDLTMAEQAKRVGCSPRMITKLRSERAEYPMGDTGAHVKQTTQMGAKPAHVKQDTDAASDRLARKLQKMTTALQMEQQAERWAKAAESATPVDNEALMHLLDFELPVSHKRSLTNIGALDAAAFFDLFDTTPVAESAFDAELQQRTEEWAARHCSPADFADLF